MSWVDSPFALVVGAAIPSSVLGYLGYRRSKHVDSVAEKSGIATEKSFAIGQVVDGLNAFIDTLQEDNKSFRDDVRYLQTRLTDVIAERDACGKELRRLYRKYGENGASTG